MVRLKIDKLIFGGQGLGRIDGQVALVWGALPGEEVEIEILKQNKKIIEGVATKIITLSPHRVEPRDSAFLSIAPWQIISFAEENRWKQIIAAETYGKIGDIHFNKDKDIEIVHDEREYGYRNKVEYNFTEVAGEVKFAVTQRGGRQKIAIEQNSLADEAVNQAAKDILAWINEIKIPARVLETLIVRGNRKGEVLAGLFTKERFSFDHYPELKNGLTGLQIYYSAQNQSSGRLKKIQSLGQEYLEQELLGTKLRFGIFSFFQINPAVFEMCLRDISSCLSADRGVVDFYSGVGAISLPLNKFFKRADLVEESEEAVFFVKENIFINNLSPRCDVFAERAEQATDVITTDKIIILDPPRAGLNERIIKKIRQEKPERIIYLSCNLSTQARDYSLLADIYKIEKIKLYNFFPRTPHVEGLMVLKRV